MYAQNHVRIWLTVAAGLLLRVPHAGAQTTAAAQATAAAKPALQDKATERDGQRDFDFAMGKWKVHLKRLVNPLTGSNTWIEYYGTDKAHPLWGGRANIDVIQAGDSAGHNHIEGLTLRLYNTESHQWSLYWANAKNGSLGMPPTVGKFDGNGRGEFYDQEEFNGRSIIVRYVWSHITPTSAHFEQSFSPDGGKTWEVNWIYDGTRVK